jgi:ribosome-associated heat shock protein Hsp15
MIELEEARIDKWLWTVRIYKTRTMAAEACKGGKVKLDGDNVKPAKSLKIGDEVIVQMELIKKTFRVKGFPKNRLSAKLVLDFMEDITPQEEIDKYKRQRESAIHYESKYGEGRPTKKDRRDLDDMW